jgi:hypothetical protein
MVLGLFCGSFCNGCHCGFHGILFQKKALAIGGMRLEIRE